MAALFFGVLSVVYIGLKQWGVIGRQFSDGGNSSSTLKFEKTGQTIVHRIEPSRRGISKYRLGFVRDQERSGPDVKYTLRVNERFCEGEIFNRRIRSIRRFIDEDGRRTYSYDYAGRLVVPPLPNRLDSVCLEITLVDMSPASAPIVDLQVGVGNTRPCWGFECLLD